MKPVLEMVNVLHGLEQKKKIKIVSVLTDISKSRITFILIFWGKSQEIGKCVISLLNKLFDNS